VAKIDKSIAGAPFGDRCVTSPLARPKVARWRSIKRSRTGP